MRKTAVISFLALSLFVSCVHSSEKTHSYFDSLVVAQVRYLSATKATVTKVVSMDGKQDRATFSPHATFWADELDLFRQLNSFEKPAYRDHYKIVDHVPDTKSNLLFRSYEAIGNTPVRALKFYYHAYFRNLKRIEAVYVEKNILYSTKRFMVMEFDELNGISILSSYSLVGSQKMILADSDRFSIDSIIAF